MEEDRSGQFDRRRDKSDKEGESCKGQVETGKGERWRLPGLQRGERVQSRMDSRRTQDRYINTVKRRRGLLLEQHIFHKEEDRDIPSDPRLLSPFFCTERYYFLMEDYHCGEADPKGSSSNRTRDLSQAYFLTPIHKSFTTFLAFKFEERFCGFKGMPFGFKDAPRIFTKVMRKVSKEIRRRWKVRCISHLDDVPLLDPDQVKLKTATQEIEKLFQKLGLIINTEKSELSPKKNFDSLGWTWSSNRMIISVEQ
ncbi:putative Reverse transcriptase (RNA-dependent DNA polymerase) [Monocercomonoides exilis]|uniref:putative Reverse transcriptase (RNA-dependent DNA polymerase) n=1 Tax=Monocercomonoides exilis TaxID=2049356 RepID=UPI00355A2D2D|nr:putative Reverse transcriptase (RNA-dependent DNA polymerase) [Monocercomonoides exilis]|eukprot:MONOS_13928.1-p1 / transcript=MONOS_13928.1 / gene=MONOS_13928 / organism=Monocercomonoides_exilis_PA203 / gene_product=unspecified product / transcript_product=unspecified product / location=Mono_scaffold00905:19697-20455(+) / protein_length=252 / sequence_SO=supercontig / SO=protein_coding / is_pseudo=false